LLAWALVGVGTVAFSPQFSPSLVEGLGMEGGATSGPTTIEGATAASNASKPELFSFFFLFFNAHYYQL